MSVHRSLKGKSALMRSRNVLTRLERIEALRKAEKWQAGMSVFGLPAMAVKRAKPKPAAAAPTEAAAPAGDEAGEAPADAEEKKAK